MLDLFRDESLFNMPHDKDIKLKTFIDLHWVKHFVSVEPFKIDVSTKKEIGRTLVKMFSDECFMKWTGYVGCKFSSSDVLAHIRKWLEDEYVLGSLDPEGIIFVESTRTAPATTLKPATLYIARKWLHEGKGDTSACYDTVYDFSGPYL
jgi:hypothetical protein